MIRPVWSSEIRIRPDPCSYFLADSSQSMNTQDGPGGRRVAAHCSIASRKPARSSTSSARRWISALSTLPKKRLTVERSLTKPTADKRRSAPPWIGFPRIAGPARFGRLPAQRRGPAAAQSEQRRSDRDAAELGDRQIPVYTVCFGGSGFSQNVMDAAVEDCRSINIAFERKVVPVKAKVRFNGMAGRKITVRLLVEDRRGKKPGESGEMKASHSRSEYQSRRHRHSEHGQRGRHGRSLVSAAGGRRIQSRRRSRAARRGSKKQNNIRQTILAVQHGGIKVAYFDTRPEQQ